MAAKELQISASNEGIITIVQVSGPVDSETLDTFKARMDMICAAKGSRILIDCTNLTYLNSRAIGLIMKYYRQLAFSRGRLAVFGVNKRLVRTLDLLHVGRELRAFETKDEAMAAMIAEA